MRSIVADVERDLGMPVVEYLAAAIIEAGSVRAAAQRLVAATTVNVSAETVKGWWPSVARADPEMARRVMAQAEDTRYIRRAVRDAERAERAGLLAEIAQVRAAVDGEHCAVCGAPKPPDRDVTCSSECWGLWKACRYHMSEEMHQKHRVLVCRRVLATSETYKYPAVKHAQRVINGEPTEDRGRWLNSERQLERLQEVMERRRRARERWGTLAAELPPIRALERGIARRPA